MPVAAPSKQCLRQIAQWLQRLRSYPESTPAPTQITPCFLRCILTNCIAHVGFWTYWRASSRNVALTIVSSSTPNRNDNSDKTAVTCSASIVNLILQPPNPIIHCSPPTGNRSISAPYPLRGFQPPSVNVPRLQPGSNKNNTNFPGSQRICAFKRG